MARNKEPGWQSSHVKSISWDPATRVLEVEFQRGGRRYRYAEVPYNTWVRLQQAESKGSFLRREIQPNHAVEEVAL